MLRRLNESLLAARVSWVHLSGVPAQTAKPRNPAGARWKLFVLANETASIATNRLLNFELPLPDLFRS